MMYIPDCLSCAPMDFDVADDDLFRADVRESTPAAFPRSRNCRKVRRYHHFRYLPTYMRRLFESAVKDNGQALPPTESGHSEHFLSPSCDAGAQEQTFEPAGILAGKT